MQQETDRLHQDLKRIEQHEASLREAVRAQEHTEQAFHSRRVAVQQQNDLMHSQDGEESTRLQEELAAMTVTVDGLRADIAAIRADRDRTNAKTDKIQEEMAARGATAAAGGSASPPGQRIDDVEELQRKLTAAQVLKAQMQGQRDATKAQHTKAYSKK
jgi:hypothetical protein